MDYKPLKYIFVPSGHKDAKTLLLLHGTGGTEEDLLPFAKYFDGPINILSVRGNVSEHGMPRFFRRLSMGVFDEKDLQFRTDELIYFLNETAATEQFDVNQIIALGYSNGANIAGSILYKYPEFLNGAILLRPMKPYQNLPKIENNKHTPVFIASGRLDSTVKLAEIDDYKQSLTDSGFSVSANLLETGHGLIQQDINLAAAWFTEHSNEV